MKGFCRFIVVIFILSVGVFAYSKAKGLLYPIPAPPVITSLSDTVEVPCAYTDEQILQGLTAQGEKDGDLTSQIMVGNISRFKTKGVSTVTYVVFDSDNQPATYTRDVRFSDYRSPEFSLSMPLVFERGGMYGSIESVIGATDVIAGNINNAVRFENNDIDFYSVGNYYLTVEASNSFGDTSNVRLPVHIVDQEDTAVQVNLTQGLVYLDRGTVSFSPSDYIESVIAPDGSFLEQSSVSFSSGVDTHNPGIYEVKYTADVGEDHGVTWLTVIVRE